MKINLGMLADRTNILSLVQISEHIALVSFSPHKIWTTFEAKQHYGPQVVYHIQTNCNENWGGSSCGYYCKPDNGLVLGHYNCSSDYKRICHYGWSGEFCNERKSSMFTFRVSS